MNDPRDVRFGTFELDLESGDLTRRGRPVRLQPQTARVLVLLARRAGRLVTHAEIRAHLGGTERLPSNQAIHSTVSQLRKALGDPAGSPAFVETVPRRGYRFVAPIHGRPETRPADLDPLLAQSARPLGRVARGVIVAAVAITVLAALWLAVNAVGSGPESGQRLVAVLPFQNPAGDDQTALLAAGITDGLIAELGTLAQQRIGVIARASSEQLLDREDPVSEAGRALGAQYVVDGTVQSRAGFVRVTVHLVRVQDRTQLWARTYDQDAEEVPDLQSLVSERVASALGTELLARTAEGVSPARTNRTAWLAYLTGRRLLDGSPSDPEASIAWFDRALETDPTYAPAYVGLAEAQTRAPDVGQERVDAAVHAVRTALRIDGSLPEAHLRLAELRSTFLRDPVGAEAEYARAVALAPGWSAARLAYAMHLARLGRPADAIGHLEEGIRLDPLSASARGDAGMIYFFARDYERAADQCTFAVEADPRSLPARLCLLRSLVRLGREEAALDQARAMIRQVGASLRYTQILDSLPTSEGLLYYREGQADWMSSQIERGRPLEYQLAITFAELGDFGRAFEWLERAASAHTPAFRSVSVDPVFDPVRSEPRFQRIRSSLGLEGKLALGG